MQQGVVEGGIAIGKLTMASCVISIMQQGVIEGGIAIGKLTMAYCVISVMQKRNHHQKKNEIKDLNIGASIYI